MLIERDETPVMFKRVADEATAISHGMAEVEKSVGLLAAGSTTGRSTTTASTASASNSARVTIRRHLGSKSARCPGAGMRGYGLLASPLVSTS